MIYLLGVYPIPIIFDSSGGVGDPMILVAMWIVANFIMLLLYVIFTAIWFLNADIKRYESFVEYLIWYDDNPTMLTVLFLAINGLALLLFLTDFVYELIK